MANKRKKGSKGRSVPVIGTVSARERDTILGTEKERNRRLEKRYGNPPTQDAPAGNTGGPTAPTQDVPAGNQGDGGRAPSNEGVDLIKNYIDGVTEIAPRHAKNLRILAMKAWAEYTTPEAKSKDESNAGKQIFQDMSNYVFNMWGENISGLTREGKEELEGRIEEALGVQEKSLIETFKEGPVDPLIFGNEYIAPAAGNLAKRIVLNKKRRLTLDVLENDIVREYIIGEAKKSGIDWFDKKRMAVSEDIGAHIEAYLRLKSKEYEIQTVRKALGY